MENEQGKGQSISTSNHPAQRPPSLHNRKHFAKHRSMNEWICTNLEYTLYIGCTCINMKRYSGKHTSTKKKTQKRPKLHVLHGCKPSVYVCGLSTILITKWVFPTIVVPQNGWFTMENSIKMDDLGVPLFLETPILIF